MFVQIVSTIILKLLLRSTVNSYQQERILKQRIMSSMKFIENPNSAVHDALCGLKQAYPSLSVDPENRIVISNEVRVYLRKIDDH